MDHREIASAALGWTYTLAWAASFLPQIALSYRRRSVTGLSIDFLGFNVLGFACYATYNIALYSSSTVREHFADAHDGRYPSVQPNDIAFAVWALTCASIIVAQAMIYERDAGQRLSTPARVILAALLAVIVFELFLASWLQLIMLLGYIKLGISIVKYLPQVYVNYRRKSTAGFSVQGQIVLDAVGGSLSVGQLLLDGGVNAAKLGLGLISLSFDTVFLVQRFVLYRERDETDERNALLDGDTA